MYKPKYRITPYFLNLIDKGSALRQAIEKSTLQVAWLPLLQREAQVNLTHSSTAIEGNQLSLAQIAAVNQGEEISASQKQEREVANYLKAIRYTQKQKETIIDERAILKLHKLLMKGLLPEELCGKYKRKQNYIINEKGTKVFTPPSPKQTSKLVKELIQWLNSPKTKKLHSILICGILHHQLVSIHPFSDGNGRLARLLGTLILYQKGFDTKNIYSLDDFFAENKNKYYQKIQQARELDNDLTYWLDYVAEGIVTTLKRTKKRIETLHVSSKYKIDLTARQEDLLRILRDSQPLKVGELQKKLKLSRARINQLITPLIKGKLIKKEGQNRATRYALA